MPVFISLPVMCAFPLRFSPTTCNYAEKWNFRKSDDDTGRVRDKGKVMSVTIASGLEFMRAVLALRGYRQQILSADIANAGTPGFKAVDLDFRQALAAATSAAPRPHPVWLADDPRDLGQSDGDLPTVAVKYQAGNPVTLDGNSVDLNQEKLWAADNAVQYEAAATFASQIIRMMTAAINGSGAQPTSGG
jgi:flagellar basal-body rod protein FlgB